MVRESSIILSKFVMEVGFRVDDFAGEEDISCCQDLVHGELAILVCVSKLNEGNSFQVSMPRVSRVQI